MRLATERERYRLVFDELETTLFEWDVQTGEFYSSESYGAYAMSDISPAVLMRNEGAIDLVHPDDLPALQRFFADTQSGKHRVKGTFRLRLKDGGYRGSTLTGFFCRDENGRLTGTIRALSRPDAKTVPIIAMSANAFDEDRRASLDAGMNAHLAKPVEPQKMYDTLWKLIDQRNG